ncbi:MAG: S-adenosylmethionine decarboxylase family protein [Candidatus Thalassarchaeaceae archaeon]|jgi:S-adenosylmethionine decarboxylase
MNTGNGRGLHIFLDYIDYTPPVENDGEWMLNKLRDIVKKSGIREVHSHVEKFDGTKSPPGFAAVILVDESHVTAHCYSNIGLLAIDVFTCGNNDPQVVVDNLKELFSEKINGIKLVREEKISRFIK